MTGTTEADGGDVNDATSNNQEQDRTEEQVALERRVARLENVMLAFASMALQAITDRE